MALTTLTGGKAVMSTETAVNALAPIYDVEDTIKELAAIKSDADAALAGQVTLAQAKPAALAGPPAR